jgi:steroid Delta-isomerase
MTTAAQTAQDEKMRTAVHSYAAALNAGDAKAIAALYAEDAVVEDPVGTTPKQGRAAILAFYEGSVGVPLRVALEGEVRCAASECAFAFSVSFSYQGQATTIRPIDTMRFNDAGQITQMRAYFGPANFSRA